MFITFESLDCAGKTTQAKLLYDYLNKEYDCVLTKQAGGCAETTGIREIAITSNLSAKAKFMLFCTDRYIHLEKVIIPALNEYKIVICDRYADSTVAYQLYGEGLLSKEPLTSSILNFSAQSITPDLTFYLDLPPEQVLQRLQQSGRVLDKYESKPLSFFKDVYEGYKKIIANNTGRFSVIDATKSIKEISNIIIRQTNMKLKYLQGDRLEDKTGKYKQTINASNKYDPYGTTLNSENLKNIRL